MKSTVIKVFMFFAVAASLSLVAFLSAPVGQASAASGRMYGQSIIRTCGWVTCSIYISHQKTAEVDNWVQMNSHTGSVVVDFVANAACGEDPICVVVVEVDLGRFLDALHHAATTNGCLRVRYIRDRDHSYPVGFYADHSSTCHSMG